MSRLADWTASHWQADFREQGCSSGASAVAQRARLVFLLSFKDRRKLPPGRLLDAWVDGGFDLVVSPHLLDELTDVLSRPKLASRLDSTGVIEILRLVREAAVMASDEPPEEVCRDPDDD